MPKINPGIETSAKIKVVGMGGSGKGAINHMIEHNTENVDFIAVNADVQDLHHCMADTKIHIGKNFTRGLGSGMDPEKGKRAAEETREEIQDALTGADMVFIAGGMGGGTGTGASPVVAKIAKEMGILTIAVVTKPFNFEGKERTRIADEGLADLEKEVDAMIVIPNDRILAAADKKTTVKEAFAMCNEVLRRAVVGISDIISRPGTYANIDFADVQTILQNSGTALMGVGVAVGEGAAVEATRQAINSTLLDVSINGAKGVLYSFCANDDLPIWDLQEAAKIIKELVDEDAKIIQGTTLDPDLKPGEVRVTLIATGFPDVQKHLYNEKRADTLGVITGNNSNSSAGIRNFFGGKQDEVKEVAPVIKDNTEKKEVAAKTEKTEKKKEIEVVAEIDDSDDWSIPAFMRRKGI
jgi:cell division protein FtsZ